MTKAVSLKADMKGLYKRLVNKYGSSIDDADVYMTLPDHIEGLPMKMRGKAHFFARPKDDMPESKDKAQNVINMFRDYVKDKNNDVLAPYGPFDLEISRAMPVKYVEQTNVFYFTARYGVAGCMMV